LGLLVYKNVARDPVVCERDEDTTTLIADLSVRGVWQPQGEALFDVLATDTDAPLGPYWWLLRIRKRKVEVCFCS